MSSPGSRPLREVTVGRLSEAFAVAGPGPAAGSLAAVTTALAAGLAAKVARGALRDPATTVTGDVLDDLDALRIRALGLADEDVAAYTGFLAAKRAPGRSDVGGGPAATEAIVQVPLDILALAVRVVGLAADLAEDGPDALVADAATAALLAATAAEAAAMLVGTNLADVGDGLDALADPRVEDAEERAGMARARAERLL